MSSVTRVLKQAIFSFEAVCWAPAHLDIDRSPPPLVALLGSESFLSHNKRGQMALVPRREKNDSVQLTELLSRVGLFVTPWTAAHQASLSITNSRGLLKLMSIESVMPSNHLILCHPLRLPPSIFPSIRIFSFFFWRCYFFLFVCFFHLFLLVGC